MEGNSFLRPVFMKQLRNSVIFSAIVALIWGALSFFIPAGWWHIVINIGFFLFSLVGAATIKNSLVLIGNPSWLAFVISIVIWLLVVILLRSIELEILMALMGP